jgi:two-component system, response regulator
MTIDKNEVFPPILIAEDEEDHARLIKRALKQAGLINEIFHVENGQEALDFLKYKGQFSSSTHSQPGLILLDLKMPMKNGFEVLEEIKSDPVLKVIPVVMLTTSSTGEDIEKAMAEGANDYIVKPVKFDDFTHKVSRIGYYWGIISDSNKYFF